MFAAGLASRSTPGRADDFAEREQALKTLGVDEELRLRVHRAIGVGSHWLAGRLASEGGAAKVRPTFPFGVGLSLLATLALAHSRTPESIAAAKASVKRLLVDDPAAVEEARSQTYHAGIAGLLAADPACEVPRSLAREIALRITAGQDARGWWGYSLATPVGAVAAARGVAHPWSGPVNLSTTQFAVLGAFGLRRAGVPVPFSVWDRHLEGLCDHQAGDGSWTYDPSRAPNGYPNGTYMGIAGLLVAEEALAGRITDPARLQRIAAVKARGLKALRRDVLAFVKSTKSAATRTRGKFPRVAGPIVVDGYGMYALEKACIFAGLERVDGESWYEAGARLLVAAQNDDGNWAGDLNTTSFALLFLTRSPERYRPIVTTVTTITDSPTRPTTPSDPRPAAPPPAMAEGGR